MSGKGLIRENPRRYLDSKTAPERDELIRSLLPLVNYIVSRLTFQLPTGVPKDHLIGSGVSALIESLNLYDPQSGQRIEAFCSVRIRKILHEKLSLLVEKSVEKKTATVSPGQLDGAPPSILPVEDFAQLLERVKLSFYLSPAQEKSVPEKTRLDGGLPLKSPNLPALSDKDKAILHDIIKNLPKEQLQVLCLHYIEELQRAEMAEVMGLTESQISNIHARAMATLRLAFGQAPRIGVLT